MISLASDRRQALHAVGRALERGAFARHLLVPEEAELVARARLHGQPQRDRTKRLRGHGRPRQIGDIGPLGRVAGVQVREHARHRAMAAFVASVPKNHMPILHDRPADAEVEVPDLRVGARRRQAAVFQVLRVVAADHPLGHAGRHRSCP